MDVGKCKRNATNIDVRFNKDSARVGDDFRDCVVETGILAKKFSKAKATSIISTRRNIETEEERETRLQQDRDKNLHRELPRQPKNVRKDLMPIVTERLNHEKKIDLNLAAFNYNKDDNYRNHKDVVIGAMNKVCSHCGALKFAKESHGMCCSNGKVVLSPLMKPPEPLLNYIS
ncbi:hypothetical protein EVAR_64897_1 [Eumeta japonica]|uniref:Uncharacterized protein n=1 Tax=Eumeta variegata TaxID=151549 RepID=A0A4C1ZSG0_EUMVA|nr:hypothetical protein EVAR_64897_1 [Eumeta japonica]